MTYDDWKTTDDTPEPEPNRCETCGHPEGYCDCPCCHEHGFMCPSCEDTGFEGRVVGSGACPQCNGYPKGPRHAKSTANPDWPYESYCVGCEQEWPCFAFSQGREK